MVLLFNVVVTYHSPYLRLDNPQQVIIIADWQSPNPQIFSYIDIVPLNGALFEHFTLFPSPTPHVHDYGNKVE